ncbi:MAG: hypothetical protein RJA61_291 [Candidatus Parcubacteria bacterium]|jgi:hypothetical protein
MKRSLLVTTFIFLSPMIVCAEVSTFVFTSVSSFPVLERQTVTLQSQNSSGEKENTANTTCIEVRTTSSTGKLFASANGTDSVSVLILTMNKNSANRNFYYEDAQPGSYSFTVKAVYRPEEEKRTCANWPVSEWGNTWNVQQSYIVGSSSGSVTPPEVPQPSTSSENSSSQQQSSGGSFPVDPQVFAEITLPSKTMIAGAQFFVSGEGYGIEKKPLANARFIWNFGDGTVKSQRSIAHTYRNPGEYLIVLDVSSEKFGGTDREVVTVIPSPLEIHIKKSGGESLVHIVNSSNLELNLSGWIVDVGGTFFVIPLHTIVLPKKTLIFDSIVLGVDSILEASLLYPNGSVADRAYLSQNVVSQPVATVGAPPSKSPVVRPTAEVSKPLVLPSPQTASAVSASVDTAVVKENEEVKTGSFWWIVGFVTLLIVASSSVFLIKRPVYNQGHDFTIKE